MNQESNYSFLQLIKDLSQLIKPYKTKFWTGVFFRLTSDLARLYPAYALSQIVQILTRQDANTTSDLIFIFIYWGISAIYFSVMHDFSKFLGYQVAENSALDLYKKTLAHVFKLDLSWQEIENSGNKMKRIDRGRDGVNEIIRRIFDIIIEVIVNITVISFIFFGLEKTISVALLLFTTSYYLLGTYLLKRSIRQEKIVNTMSEDLGGITFEGLNNIQTIKSLSIDQGIMDTVSGQTKSLVAEIKKRILLFRSGSGILNLYEHLFEFGIICFISYGIIQGRYEISLLILFIGLFQKVGDSANELTDVTQQIAIAKIWISRAMDILNTKPVIENPAAKGELLYPPEWKQLRIDNVYFKYKKRDALKKISLTINRGESIGIVGLSGAGKSTLFKLLLDLYEDYEGNIYLDKTPFKKMNRQSYIDRTAVVLQDTELFNLSLKDNITIAGVKNQSNTVSVNDAIKMSHLTDVVSNLAQGLDTLVGEKGVKLSGGQRQRVGIARALFRQPDILLLDEATSHLDAYSERQIQEALAENLHKFTTIIIAHRLSTIKEVDKIVVLEKGAVSESGTFEELLRANGAFSKMWKEQKI